MKKGGKKTKEKAWVVAVNMGYGHQRAAHPLNYLAAGGEVQVANNYLGIPPADRRIWKESRRFYEYISRFKNIPILGRLAFDLYDQFQSIPQFYPRRDLSKPNFPLRQIYRLIEKEQWGKHLIDKLAKRPLPLITTFFVPAFMAEVHHYPGDIYCVATDTDISRTWAPLKPNQSRIKYFAPNYRVAQRLELYGVSKGNIFLTGFPLPRENIGGLAMTTLRRDVVQRLANLDPKRKFCDRYQVLVQGHLKVKQVPEKSNHLLTLMFSVGGAAAQKEIGAQILHSLKHDIAQKRIRIILVAGIHNSVSTYFRNVVRAAGLGSQIGHEIEIIFSANKEDYFNKFDAALRTTDILWTKPSELSFYCALGIPIVIAPPIGSQEIFNRKWLRTIGAGASQYQPRYTNEWLFDWVESGWFAEAVMEGFMEAPKFVTYNIEKILDGKLEEVRKVVMTLQY